MSSSFLKKLEKDKADKDKQGQGRGCYLFLFADFLLGVADQGMKEDVAGEDDDEDMEDEEQKDSIKE